MNGLVKLPLAHSRLVAEIFCASRNLTVDDAFNSRQIIIHTNIDNTQLKTMLAAEHIHTTTTMGEVDHLLPGHLTG